MYTRTLFVVVAIAAATTLAAASKFSPPSIIDIIHIDCFLKTIAVILGCSDRAWWLIRAVHRAVHGLHTIQIARLQKT